MYGGLKSRLIRRGEHSRSLSFLIRDLAQEHLNLGPRPQETHTVRSVLNNCVV